MSKKVPTVMSPSDTAVSLKGVTKIFTQWQRDTTGKSILKNLIKPEKNIITALQQVSFEIKKGEFVAYAGPNGAGKSTTMKLLSGMLLPDAGEISVLSLSPHQQRRSLMRRLGVLFGNRTELWWDHPVIQSFEWKKVVWDIPEPLYRKNLAMVTELLDLESLLHTFARELSLGQRMRADLGMMLLHDPQVILLDEPTLGLDVAAKRRMIDFLKLINKERGVTILVTSHDMADLEEMAQRILMIAQGKIAYDGSFNGLRDITGNLTRFRITTDGQQSLSLNGGKLIRAENGVYEFEIDVSRYPVKLLLEQLSGWENIKDVEIAKAPIEQVIVELFAMLAARDKAACR